MIDSGEVHCGSVDPIKMPILSPIWGLTIPCFEVFQAREETTGLPDFFLAKTL